MKNLFLTFALMCCVSFAFANEGEDDESFAKVKVSTEEKADMAKVELDSKQNFFVMNCYALSCGTLCSDGSLEEAWDCDTEDDTDSVAAWYMFETVYCGGQGI